MPLRTHYPTSLAIVFLFEGKLEFHITMCCIYVQFYNSKVLRSECRNSASTKMELLLTIMLSIVSPCRRGLYLSCGRVPGSTYYSKILSIVQFIACSFSFVALHVALVLVLVRLSFPTFSMY